MTKWQVNIFILAFILVFTNAGAQQLKEYYLECQPSDFAMIYTNYNDEIYIPVAITYNGVKLENAEMRIRGDGSVVLPKKSLKVKISEGNFEGVSVFNFNADYEDKSYIQAYTSSRLMRESGTPCFESEHVRLYLNGNYLGLYISVENMDGSFLSRNGFNPNGNLYKATLDGASLSRYDNVFYHWEQKTGAGNREDLQELIFQLDTIPISNYKAFLQEHFDYDEVVNVLAMNLLTRNHSTYYHNYYLFHDTFGTGKWYMFPWDLDKGFLYYENTIPYYHTSKFWAPDNPLMELACLSPEVISDIESRIDILHETLANDANVTVWVDSLNLLLSSSVAADNTDILSSNDEWLIQMNQAKTAFNYNYSQLKYQFHHILKPFRLQRIKSRYYQGEPILFTWNECIDPDSSLVKYRLYVGNDQNLENGNAFVVENLRDTSYLLSINIEPGKYYFKLEAYKNNFRAEAYDNYNVFFVDNDSTKLVINEINYNSDATANSGEWIELYNYTEDTVDISGWWLSDNNDLHQYIFPEGSLISPDTYMIIANDSIRFFSVFPYCRCLHGVFNFSLDNNGELIRLYNKTGRMVDSLHYLPVAPWPTKANGNGSSLELNNALSDNALGENWLASVGYGSPCQASQTGNTSESNNTFLKLRAFPNPFTELCVLVYYSYKNSEACIKIYDINGNIVFEKFETHDFSGYFTTVWNAESISNGIYLVSLFENGILKKTIRVGHIK